MSLTNMKLTSKEKKSYSTVSSGLADKGPDYPWGLTINLEKEAINKLGIDIRNMKVGAEVSLMAKAKITSVSERKDNEGESQSLSIQITDISLDNPKKRPFQSYDKKMNEGPTQ